MQTCNPSFYFYVCLFPYLINNCAHTTGDVRGFKILTRVRAQPGIDAASINAIVVSICLRRLAHEPIYERGPQTKARGRASRVMFSLCFNRKVKCIRSVSLCSTSVCPPQFLTYWMYLRIIIIRSILIHESQSCGGSPVSWMNLYVTCSQTSAALFHVRRSKQ